jgi:hypothetical protein
LNGMSACVKNLDPKVNFLCLLSLPFLRLTFLTRRQLFIACITYLSKLTLLSSHRRAHHNLTEKAKINHWVRQNSHINHIRQPQSCCNLTFVSQTTQIPNTLPTVALLHLQGVYLICKF